MKAAHLGCGTIILPATAPLPESYVLFSTSAGLYDPAVEWDNIDINDLPGVDRIINLFDYPWPIEDNTYDAVVISHLAEHIPHHIMRGGELIGHDPEFQDGFFAFFGELWRILKPGGILYCAVPYAWSNSGISDPTHTRYLTPATIYYLINADGVNSTFKYRTGGQWQPLTFEDFTWRPHENAVKEIIRTFQHLREYALFLTKGTYDAGVKEEWFSMWRDFRTSTLEARTILNNFAEELMQTGVNMAADFMVTLTAVKA